MKVIEIENLNFSYFGSDRTLKDVNLTFHEGLYSICGPNGAGKTTLLKIISKILDNYEGSVKIYGKDIKDIRIKDIPKILSFIVPNISTPFDFKVIDILLMGRISYLDFFASYSKADLDIVLKVAKKTGIEGILNRNFLELSSGEKELVLLSQSFIQDCPIILMDEPFLHLDLKHKLSLIKILKEYISDKNGTGVVVLHDLRIAFSYCDDIIFMKDGRVVEKINATAIKNKIDLISEIYEVSKEEVRKFLY
jgi:iron complex transport system ATP-binding protein